MGEKPKDAIGTGTREPLATRRRADDMQAGESPVAQRQDDDVRAALPTKRGRGRGDGAPEKRWSSDDEFEAFWDRLEDEAQAEGAAVAAPAVVTSAASASVGETEGVSGVSDTPAYDHLLATMGNRPLAGELMRRTLETCLDRQPYALVEEAVQTFPGFATAGLSPWQVISTLVDAQGLRRIELDVAGEEVLPEQKAGLTDDEADDLVESYALETTDLGRLAVEELAPSRRLAELIDLFCDRRGVFSELLSYCQQAPRTYRDIEALFVGRDFSGIATLNPEPGVAIQPSVFVDNLEKAGGLVWDDGWRVTREGAMLLERLIA